MVKPKSAKNAKSRDTVSIVLIVGSLVILVGAIVGLGMTSKNPNVASDQYTFSQYKPPINKAAVADQALADIKFIIESINYWLEVRGESLTLEEIEVLEQYYVDQTLDTVGDYYNLE